VIEYSGGTRPANAAIRLVAAVIRSARITGWPGCCWMWPMFPTMMIIRKKNGHPNWRVMLAGGCRSDVEALHEEIACVLAPMGLTAATAEIGV
jgi:hypothetical protein